MTGARLTLAERLSARLRRLDQRLHIDRAGGSEWIWAVPALTFVGILALFVVLGVMSGVWAAEYIPTGLVIAVVISGLVVACMNPGSDLPEGLGGDGGVGPRPESPSLPPDPGVWIRLLAEVPSAPAPGGVGERGREPVGTSPH